MYPRKPLVMGNHRRDVAEIEEFGYMVSLDGKLYGTRNTEIKKQNVKGYDVWQVCYARGVAKTRTLRANIGTYCAWTGDRETEGYNIHHIDHCNTNNHLFNLVKLVEREHLAYHAAFDRLPNETQVYLLKLLNNMVTIASKSKTTAEDYKNFTPTARYIIQSVINSEKTGELELNPLIENAYGRTSSN